MSLLMVMITLFPIMLISVLMPYVTRKTESFGVSIPEDFYASKVLIEMRKKYVIITTILSLVVLISFALMITLFGEKWFDITFAIVLGIFLIGSFIIYLGFHNQMKKLKVEKDWKNLKFQTISVDTKFHQQKKTYSSGWFIIPFGITICTFIITFLFYKDIPKTIPMKYDFKGNVTNWSDKSYWTVLQLPITQLFLTGLFLFINTIISRSKQQINSANPEKSIKQNVIFRRRWSIFTLVSGTLLVCLFFLIQLSFIFEINIMWLEGLSIGLVGIILVGCIVISIITGQGGSRVRIAEDKKNSTINYDDDQYWKLGVFYFNANDPSVWVEKRFGSGWTINMARPIGWIILLIIILIPIAISVLT